MMGLIDLVEDFSQAYAQEKKKRNLLDFSDLEHFAVRLLTDEAGQPTDLARQWGAQYTERSWWTSTRTPTRSRTPSSRPCPMGGETSSWWGDVKQSIYRFRLADPTIFLRSTGPSPL